MEKIEKMEKMEKEETHDDEDDEANDEDADDAGSGKEDDGAHSPEAADIRDLKHRLENIGCCENNFCNFCATGWLWGT